MRTDFWYPSRGAGRIHGCKWTPEGSPRAVVQIVHGITEYVERYDAFARYLANRGFLVVAEDHMGHGKSVNGDGIHGYFHGGWSAAVSDCHWLLQDTRLEYPDLPYILLGHSMGSFLARSILHQYPDSGISAVVLSGTAWQPTWLLPAVHSVMKCVCNILGETKVSTSLLNGSYRFLNRRVKHPKTLVDWVCGNDQMLDNHSMLVGRQPTVGLLRDMVQGVREIQDPKNLQRIPKELPVFMISGEEDPVGNFGKGLYRMQSILRNTGMTDVSLKIYPAMRHEVLNELRREEVFKDIAEWIEKR